MAFSVASALAQASKALADLKATLTAARDLLVEQRARFPDLASVIDPQVADLDAKITALDEQLSPEAIANLAVAVIPELVNIAKGKIDPKPHAADSV